MMTPCSLRECLNAGGNPRDVLGDHWRLFVDVVEVETEPLVVVVDRAVVEPSESPHAARTKHARSARTIPECSVKGLGTIDAAPAQRGS
jgi:hypothetical protein